MTESATPPPPPPPPALPYGTWPSPITAADVAGRRRLVSYPRGIGKDVWWQERLPAEEGRVTVVHLGADGKRRLLLPGPWNARTRVHEYGGLSYLPVPARGGAAGGQTAIMFVNYADQRLYLLEPAGPAARTAAIRVRSPPSRTGARSTRRSGMPTSRSPPATTRCGASRSVITAAR